MITPEFKGGHEVTKPVYVEGDEEGDAIAIFIEELRISSDVTASGNDNPFKEGFVSDPFVDGKCPKCGTLNPETEIAEIGENAVRCKNCGEHFTPFKITEGYTIRFDESRKMGITLNKSEAEKMAEDAKSCMNLSKNSVQNPIVSMAPTDVSGIARLRVKVIKELNNKDPLLLPVAEDLPSLAKPYSKEEMNYARSLAKQWEIKVKESYPVSFVGTGKTLNDATENGMKRAADLFKTTVPEIMNRSTITGSIDIGRNPGTGTVTVTFLVPKSYLTKTGLLNLVEDQYD